MFFTLINIYNNLFNYGGDIDLSNSNTKLSDNMCNSLSCNNEHYYLLLHNNAYDNIFSDKDIGINDFYLNYHYFNSV